MKKLRKNVTGKITTGLSSFSDDMKILFLDLPIDVFIFSRNVFHQGTARINQRGGEDREVSKKQR